MPFFAIDFRSAHFHQTFNLHGFFGFLSLTLRCTWKTRPGRATCTAHAVGPSDVRAMCQARASGILQPQPQQPQPGLVQSVVPKQRPSTSSSEAGIPGCCQRGRDGEYEFVFRLYLVHSRLAGSVMKLCCDTDMSDFVTFVTFWISSQNGLTGLVGATRLLK